MALLDLYVKGKMHSKTAGTPALPLAGNAGKNQVTILARVLTKFRFTLHMMTVTCSALAL